MRQPPELLTIGEAAEYLSVSTQTVRRWADAGSLPAIRTPGNQRRFRREDVEALLSEPTEHTGAAS
jgi:excisionase family DNA binding protein